MKRRIALDGLTDDALRILPRLADHPDVELVGIYDPDAAAHRRRVALLDPAIGGLVQRLLTDDPRALADLDLLSIADAGALCGESERPSDARADLLHALGEVADTLALARDVEALHARILEVAVGATGATHGTLLLVDADGAALRVAAATRIERELWPKICVGLGAGVAGRTWAEERACIVRGAADPAHFELWRPRSDVASALCLPLLDARRVVGVLCLHHEAREDCFGDRDLGFAAALGAIAGRIVAAATAGATGARAARRIELDAEVARGVAAAVSLDAALAWLCGRAAAELPGAAASLWWRDGDDASAMRLAASSHAGGGLGSAAALAPGEGLDGRAAREGVPVLLRDGDRLAYAALPLADAGERLGVLAVQCGDAVPRDADVWLESLAAAAATALGRRWRDERMRARALLDAAASEAALAILAAGDAGRVAEQLAASARLVLGVEHALVRVVDAEARRVRLRAPNAALDLDPDLLALDRRSASEALRRRIPVEAAPVGDAPAGLVVPLIAGGRALGTLGLYAETPLDAERRARAERLAAVAARALGGTPVSRPAGALVPFAELERRIDAEIARARAVTEARIAFALVSCRIETAADPAAARARAARAFGERLRAFDLAAHGPGDAIFALLPEAGPSPTEHVARLARAISESIAKDDPAHAALAFGYALHPADGGTARELFARAAEPRIRML